MRKDFQCVCLLDKYRVILSLLITIFWKTHDNCKTIYRQTIFSWLLVKPGAITWNLAPIFPFSWPTDMSGRQENVSFPIKTLKVLWVFLSTWFKLDVQLVRLVHGVAHGHRARCEIHGMPFLIYFWRGFKPNSQLSSLFSRLFSNSKWWQIHNNCSNCHINWFFTRSQVSMQISQQLI